MKPTFSLGTEPMILVPMLGNPNNPIDIELEGCGCSASRGKGAGGCACGSVDGGGS